MLRKILASLATIVLALGIATAAGMPANATEYTNHPENWDVPGETCVKPSYSSENSSISYADIATLLDLTGKTVTKVVVKAGSSNGPNGVVENHAYYTDAAYKIDIEDTIWTQVSDLTTTTFSTNTGKGISHIIVCYTTPPAPQSVAVSGTPTNELCVVESKTLTPGSILLAFTGPSSGVTVTYRKQGAVDPTYLPVGSNPLTNLQPGVYEFLVTPVSAAYTTTTPSFTVTILADTNPACDTVVKVIGDPFDFQECVATGSELDLTSEWVATLTIDTADTEPAGSVAYRVFFWDGDSWEDQGIWPTGVYTVGPGGDIPYGTKVKVVAEALSPYVIQTPASWEFDFVQPLRCDQPTLGIVTPVVTFSDTCSANPTYTLSIEGGVQGTVLWRVNGGAPTTQLGTFAAPTSSVSVVASPAPPAGFDGDGQPRTFTKTFGDAATCGDLTTLALTGDDLVAPLWIAGFLGLLGTALVRTGRHNARLGRVS